MAAVALDLLPSVCVQSGPRQDLLLKTVAAAVVPPVAVGVDVAVLGSDAVVELLVAVPAAQGP